MSLTRYGSDLIVDSNVVICTSLTNKEGSSILTRSERHLWILLLDPGNA